MSNNQEQNFQLDLIGIIKLLLKWKKPIIIIMLVAAVASYVFTLPVFITPKFKSEAIFYPSNLSPYSDESPTEQLLQLLQSEDIRDNLIEDFNLFEHYEIDIEQEFPKTEMYNRIKENIKFSKTEFESINMTVWDTDARIAAEVSDSIMSYVHALARRLQKEKVQEVYDIIKVQVNYKKYEMDSMERSLNELRNKYGILDYEEQTKSLTEVYYKALVEGKYHSSNRNIELVLKNLKEKGGDFISLSEHLYRTRGAFNDLKVELEEAEREIKRKLTYTNLITKPVAAERKAYPVRSLMMVIIVGSVFFLTILLIILFEKYKSEIKPNL
ncbi:MAG: hypothetical protein HKO56_08960 [Bacteroidia bacterium]|nr:hypothetical protein [Bacteroidia bacterium]NNM16775.1 hypothetical protein [Bacteroidia bacterium]